MDTIESALTQLKNGGMIVVVDDENRENEGDLVCAASLVTPDHINFMAKEGRGLVCLALTQAQGHKLNLSQQQRSPEEGDMFKTAFTNAIDAKAGVTTGISAFDRAKTIELASRPHARSQDFVTPGHVFPLLAKENGVLERRGHTEAAVDMTRLAGLPPAGVICEIMADDGTMMRLPELTAYAYRHHLPLVSIEQLVAYRLKHEIEALPALTTLPTKWGTFNMRVYRDAFHQDHLVLWKGDLEGSPPPYVRIHSECLTGDVFGSRRCDCGEQLQQSMQRIAEAEKGIIIYLRQEGRGIGLANKIAAYALQDQGLDTVQANIALGFPADLRRYDVVGKALNDLKIEAAQVLTDNPHKIAYVQGCLPICERVALRIPPCPDNRSYLNTKAEKFGHLREKI